VREAGARLRRLLAVYRDAEDLISVGAYVEGSNPEIDAAVGKMPALNRFLRQAVEERFTMADTLKTLGELSGLEIPEEELGGEAVSLSPRAAARA
jgi:flagellum-specific ATP synthase